MKKLVVLGIFLAILSVSAFALPAFKVSLGVGGFYQRYTTKIDTALTPNYEDVNANWGVYGLLDLTYLEANAGMAFGTKKLATGSPYSVVPFSLASLNLAAYLKYPIVLGPVTIFPLAGFDYNLAISATQGSAEYKRGNFFYANQFDAFLIGIGGGLDIHINPKLYIRAELRWGFRLKNDDEKSAITTAKYVAPNTSFFSTGPKITAALGSSF
jgi:hypothetical protein